MAARGNICYGSPTSIVIAFDNNRGKELTWSREQKRISKREHLLGTAPQMKWLATFSTKIIKGFENVGVYFCTAEFANFMVL
jgi:hypothetical protein